MSRQMSYKSMKALADSIPEPPSIMTNDKKKEETLTKVKELRKRILDNIKEKETEIDNIRNRIQEYKKNSSSIKNWNYKEKVETIHMIKTYYNKDMKIYKNLETALTNLNIKLLYLDTTIREINSLKQSGKSLNTSLKSIKRNIIHKINGGNRKTRKYQISRFDKKMQLGGRF